MSAIKTLALASAMSMTINLGEPEPYKRTGTLDKAERRKRTKAKKRIKRSKR